MSERIANAKILPIRPGAGLAGISLAAGILAFWIAKEANHNLERNHVHASFAPFLLYGGVYWIWWVIATWVLWTLTDRWPSVLKPSALTIMAHLGAAYVLRRARFACESSGRLTPAECFAQSLGNTI